MSVITVLTSRKNGNQTTLTPEGAEGLKKAMGNTKFNQRFTATTKEVADPTERTLSTSTKKVPPSSEGTIA